MHSYIRLDGRQIPMNERLVLEKQFKIQELATVVLSLIIELVSIDRESFRVL